jgi:hypothetical protein
MTVPKGFKKNIRLHPQKEGVERRQELLDNINEKGTYLPRGVMYEDMDKSFIDFVKEELNFVVDGERIPVIFLTIQRWAEFARSWEFTDEFKDISVPFITIVRKPDVQEGTNQQALWNIPGRPTFSYIRVPTNYDGRKGVDVYKIPQPVAVDITYEVRIFCNKMRTLNNFNLKMQQTFRSRQHYIWPNEHPMPLHLENVGDESNIEDFENRRFYVQLFELLLKGYVMDEEEFEVVPAIDRVMLFTEARDDVPQSPKIRVSTSEGSRTVTYTVVGKPLADSDFSTKIQLDLRFNSINIISNVSSVSLFLDGTPVTVPFVASAGQTLRVTFERNVYKTGKFQLLGEIL